METDNGILLPTSYGMTSHTEFEDIHDSVYPCPAVVSHTFITKKGFPSRKDMCRERIEIDFNDRTIVVEIENGIANCITYYK